MAPMISSGFADLLLPTFEEVWDSEYPHEPDMIPMVYDVVPTNGREIMTFTSVGTMSDFEPFTGSIPFDEFFQGYDTTLTPLEFAKGFEVQRKLYDDEQYQAFSQRPRQLKQAAWRTHQKHAARIFNNGFSNDTFFYVNSEGVPLFSDSHTTTSNASTAVGFDNYITQAFSTVSLKTARILASTFKGDQAERINLKLDTLLYPPDLYEEVHEVVESAGNPDDSTNAANVHMGGYKKWEWGYLQDASTVNWFVLDSMMMKQFLKWTWRVPLEFGAIEDFDTLVAKFRAYNRYGACWTNWRIGVGAEVG